MDERDDIPNIGKDTIRSFVFGELTYHDALKVEEAVSKSEQLQNWVREYELTQEVLYQGRMEELKHLIPDQFPKPNNVWKWWMGGLVLVLIGGIMSKQFISYVNKQRANYSDVAIAQRHFLPPLDPRTANNSTGLEDYRAALRSFFDDKDYAAAKTLFTQLSSTDEFYASSSLYLLAHADFLLGEYAVAKRTFAQTLADEKLRLSEQQTARWNAMLTDLALGIEINEQLKNSWPANWLVPLKDDLQSTWR